MRRATVPSDKGCPFLNITSLFTLLHRDSTAASTDTSSRFPLLVPFCGSPSRCRRIALSGSNSGARPLTSRSQVLTPNSPATSQVDHPQFDLRSLAYRLSHLPLPSYTSTEPKSPPARGLGAILKRVRITGTSAHLVASQLGRYLTLTLKAREDEPRPLRRSHGPILPNIVSRGPFRDLP